MALLPPELVSARRLRGAEACQAVQTPPTNKTTLVRESGFTCYRRAPESSQWSSQVYAISSCLVILRYFPKGNERTFVNPIARLLYFKAY